MQRRGQVCRTMEVAVRCATWMFACVLYGRKSVIKSLDSNNHKKECTANSIRGRSCRKQQAGGCRETRRIFRLLVGCSELPNLWGTEMEMEDSNRPDHKPQTKISGAAPLVPPLLSHRPEPSAGVVVVSQAVLPSTSPKTDSLHGRMCHGLLNLWSRGSLQPVIRWSTAAFLLLLMLLPSMFRVPRAAVSAWSSSSSIRTPGTRRIRTSINQRRWVCSLPVCSTAVTPRACRTIGTTTTTLNVNLQRGGEGRRRADHLLHRHYSNPTDGDESEIPYHKDFGPGTKVQVEVRSFGPLGASVDVISLSHDPDDLIPADDPPLASGLVLQSEISYFREWRHNVDVVQGEVLPAYCERVRAILEDGTPRIDVSLRAYGGKAKAKEISELIMERIEAEGEIPVGDKSKPGDINREFPGVSKGAFKKAVARLYKKKQVQPGDFSVKAYSN